MDHQFDTYGPKNEWSVNNFEKEEQYLNRNQRINFKFLISEDQMVRISKTIEQRNKIISNEVFFCFPSQRRLLIFLSALNNT